MVNYGPFTSLMETEGFNLQYGLNTENNITPLLGVKISRGNHKLSFLIWTDHFKE